MVSYWTITSRFPLKLFIFTKLELRVPDGTHRELVWDFLKKSARYLISSKRCLLLKMTSMTSKRMGMFFGKTSFFDVSFTRFEEAGLLAEGDGIGRAGELVFMASFDFYKTEAETIASDDVDFSFIWHCEVAV